jgi:hypothetical protein
VRTISFIPLPTIKEDVPNQYSGSVSKYRGYFSSSAGRNRYFIQEEDDDSVMNDDFRPFHASLEGALICKLQRGSVKSDDQSELIYTLFIAWKSESYKKFRIFVHLMECDKTFLWDEIKIEEYYQNYASQLSIYTGLIRNTWLMHDGTVLMTELELDFMQGDGELNLTISKGIGYEYTRRPEWINLNR